MTFPKLILLACAIAVTGILTGCPPTTTDPLAATLPRSAATVSTTSAAAAAPKTVATQQLSADPSAAPKRRLMQLKIYQLVLPLGTISRSEEFWKHVDEDRVDIGTYDLLRKNGWRLGVAPGDEWPYFQDILNAYPSEWNESTLSAGLNGGGTVEVPMKDKIAYQNIFYFPDRGSPIGLTFKECENLLGVGLQSIARKPNEARVTVCPIVRGMRSKFEVNRNGDEIEIRYAHPEHLYDLNIQADVPLGHLLIIAPSPQVRWKTSLGATFLVQAGTAEQLEQVMLLVPRVSEVDELPIAPTSTIVK